VALDNDLGIAQIIKSPSPSSPVDVIIIRDDRRDGSIGGVLATTTLRKSLRWDHTQGFSTWVGPERVQRLGRVSLPSINNRESATPISRVFTPGLNRTVASYGTPLANNIINPELMPQGTYINIDLMRLYNEESLSVEVDDTSLENINNQESRGSTERSNIIDSNLIVSLVLNATEVSGSSQHH